MANTFEWVEIRTRDTDKAAKFYKDLLGQKGDETMVTYVTDTSKWEDWHNDYRLGLILIMPPPEVAALIDPLKSKYDPKAFYSCPTHISISDPLRLEMTHELDEEISGILGRIDPFMLYYDKPMASRDHAGVAYPITPQEPIDELKEKLHQAAIFEGKVYGRRDIPAHMTIAEFVTIKESWRICEEIQDNAPSGSFLCNQLEFIVPDINMQFQRVKTYTLGAG